MGEGPLGRGAGQVGGCCFQRKPPTGRGKKERVYPGKWVEIERSATAEKALPRERGERDVRRGSRAEGDQRRGQDWSSRIWEGRREKSKRKKKMGGKRREKRRDGMGMGDGGWVGGKVGG